MTITASAQKPIPLRADLLAVTAALAQKAARGLQLNPSASIDKAALNRIYLLIPAAASNRPQVDTPPLRSPRSLI